MMTDRCQIRNLKEEIMKLNSKEISSYRMEILDQSKVNVKPQNHRIAVREIGPRKEE